MTEDDSEIIEFCVALAKGREIFRSAHIHAEKQSFFREVKTTVSVAQGEFNEALLRGQGITEEQPVHGVEISYSLDASLCEAIDDDKYSMGASVAVRSLRNHWLLQGEVGWSCKSCGWDDYETFEEGAQSARDVINAIPIFCERVLSSYKSLVEHHNPSCGRG